MVCCDVTGRVGAASRGVYPADIDPVWWVVTSQDELERRREECIQLRTVIANNASLPMCRLEDRDTSEEGEVLMAFETQKQINR